MRSLGAARAAPVITGRDPQIDRLGRTIKNDHYFKTTATATPDYRTPRSRDCIVPEGDDPHRQHVLAWLRCLRIRVSMFRTEIDYIGTSLKGGFVTPDDAMAWLDELDPMLLALVGAKDSQ